MKHPLTLLAALALVALVIAATRSPAPPEEARFIIQQVGERTFKLETLTGRSWIGVGLPFRGTNGPDVPVFLWVECVNTTSEQLMYYYSGQTNSVQTGK